jgi:hypothetical protein
LPTSAALQPPNPVVRALSAAAALVLVWCPVGVLTLLEAVGYDLHCDGYCDPSAPGWANRADSWEWHALLWALAVPALACATATVAYLFAGRPRRAGAALALTVALVLASLLFGATG